MNKLGIIILGQIRTFFNYSDFTDLINLSKKEYEIYIFCILNSNEENDFINLNKYLSELQINYYEIIDYKKYKDLFFEIANQKLNNPNFLKLKEKYFSKYLHSHVGLNNPENYFLNHFIQHHQLKIGIEYLKKKNIIFDVIFKTRFDAKYHDNFYPKIINNDDLLNVISFNPENKTKISNSMNKNNISTFDELINFNKNKRINAPLSHLDIEDYALSFGGRVCYNYESLDNIKNNINNILYSFNDYYFFSNHETFLKLDRLINDAYLFEPNNPDLYNHIFCPESQLIIFCLNNKIDIIMYAECFYNTMINR